MDPISISQQPEPQIPVAPMISGQIPMAMPQLQQPQPYAVPQASPQVPYSISISGVAAPPAPAQPQGAALALHFKPMPNNCQDYSEPRCHVFLDWPTGINCRNDYMMYLPFIQDEDELNNF